jgi:1-acyl-sn-glycerol-3-phosphate acyltransferase
VSGTGLYRTVASVWTWFVLVACLILWLPILVILVLVTAPFDPGRYWAGLWFRKLAVVTATLNPLWRFRTSGYQVTDPRRPYVAVSNHESFVDILLISHLPWEMKWLSKIELFRIPIIGWDMWIAGDIAIHRGRGASAADAMQRCREVLERRISVMIFPEGTRSTTDQMLPFKDGAFRLAIEAGVPILPLVVAGAREALPKHDWRFAPSRAELHVLPPVETTGMTLKDVGALRDRVRELIRAERERMRAAED